LTCPNCQLFFPVADVLKHQISQQELSEAGFAGLFGEGLQLRKDDRGSEEDSTVSGKEVAETRCARCGNRIPVTVLSCNRCGQPTPLGRASGVSSSGTVKISSSGQSTAGVKTTSKTKSPTKRLTTKTKPFFPKFIADLPWAKIKVPPGLAIVLTIAIPLTALAYYFYSTNQYCFNCIQVAGNYSADLSTEGKKVRVELLLYQYQGMVTGKVRFTPIPDPAAPGAPKLPPPQQFVEIIQAGAVNNSTLSFQTYAREGEPSRVQFTGQMTEDSILNGNLQVTMPEFDWVGKTFPISVKKS
jgi:hypothetical protein